MQHFPSENKKTLEKITHIVNSSFQAGVLDFLTGSVLFGVWPSTTNSTYGEIPPKRPELLFARVADSTETSGRCQKFNIIDLWQKKPTFHLKLVVLSSSIFRRNRRWLLAIGAGFHHGYTHAVKGFKDSLNDENCKRQNRCSDPELQHCADFGPIFHHF